jgi:carbamoyl-phosphate synthase large subunit
MPKRTDIKSILVIGSGPIVIGQACEFDYSGTQAIKALKEEGYKVILVNSNPATIMTDPEFADRTYIEPITVEFLTKVIERERPDAVLPTIGGQTALNAALGLEEAGVLKKYNCELIGASVEAIKKAEDREAFKQVVASLGLESAKSILFTPDMDVEILKKEINFPMILRPSRTLGGSGGGIVENESELKEKLDWAFECSPNKEVLVEESLIGWKEMELEVMRDRKGNGVIVCSIENIDPMGLHTGDSITVAPIQTLTDKEMQLLRDSSLRILNAVGVDTGGSNVQFSINPKTGRQIVIEMNPRVSRSSALASKATGFPIAKIAAKLAVGYTLDELPNDITKMTPACFEPSIDYVVVKIPRFAFEKFQGADQTLGTQMKSVGEAMAIGRTFPEALQKACRSLELGRTGLLGGPESKEDLKSIMAKIPHLNSTRMYQIARALELGANIDELYQTTGFDPWFLSEMKKIVDLEKSLTGRKLGTITKQEMLAAKKLGASDQRLAQLLGVEELELSKFRRELDVRPGFKVVDTCAAEFSSNTPYLYSTYDDFSDAAPTDKKKIVILGGGPNRIGQGLEFDYCCVHAAFALKDAGYETIMVNCNPETVSTDYDTSDRLYFEPLTLEDVTEILDREKPYGVIVQYGGQTPLKLAQALKSLGAPIIGTSPDAIDLAEDREKFNDVVNHLNLKQAESGFATNGQQATAVAEALGFPLLIRPSFVLGGRAMAIIHSFEELDKYIRESVSVSNDRPVLLDRFLGNAIEVDVDCVADGTDVVVVGICEHIERAGVHSGDSSFMLPAPNLKGALLKEIEETSRKLAVELEVRGLMNLQLAIVGGKEVYVLEVNPRASRSIPFVSKVTGVPWAKVAARVMAGETLAELSKNKVYGELLSFKDYEKAISKYNYVAVKESVFPFTKFKGADALLGPEMRSTGEVMGIDKNAAGGFMRAQLGAGLKIPTSGTALITVRDLDKEVAIEIARSLWELGFKIVATAGTASFFKEHGIPAEKVNKVREGSPHIVDLLKGKEVTMVINTPEGSGSMLDSKPIRQTAIEQGIALFTTIDAASAAVEAIKKVKSGYEFGVCSIQEYLAEAGR